MNSGMYDGQPACPNKYYWLSASAVTYQNGVTYHFVGRCMQYAYRSSCYFTFKIRQENIHEFQFVYLYKVIIFKKSRRTETLV